MNDTFRRARLTAVTSLGLCLTLLPAGQAQASQAPAKIRVPCNDIAALKAAIDKANTGGGSILLAPRCTYSVLAPDNPDDGLPEITGRVRISGGDRTVIQRAPGSPAFRLFHVKQRGSLSLGSLSVRGGESAPVSGSSGCGIYNEGGTATLTRVTVADNTSSGFGGGIANVLGRLVLKNTTVRDNHAVWGGGVGTSGTMAMRRGAIRDNVADNWGGGLANGGASTLNHVSVDGNDSRQLGGGVVTMSVNDQSGPLRTNFTRVRGNFARTDGGGLYAGADETTTLYRNIVSRNSANGGPTSGGGIANPGVSLNLVLQTDGSGAQSHSRADRAAQTPFEVNLIRSAVFKNTPTNCAPPNSVPRCDAVGSSQAKNTLKPGRS